MKLTALTLAMCMAFPVMAADDFDLSDMLPARPGQAIANKDNVTVKEDMVLAKDGKDAATAVAVAQAELLEDNEDGVRMIQVGSGTGILSIGTSSYQTYDNMNATLLSKRGAYTEAYMKAKKQLMENLKGVEHSCENLASSAMDYIDTGADSTGNMAKNIAESCRESVSGSLAGFVTFDVFDNVDEKVVKVSLISTPKTRQQIRRNTGAVAQTTEPNVIFKQVIDDIKQGVLPPVGAKVLTNPDTQEVIVLGYGSSIIRKNKNATMERELKKAAKSQAETRARDALLATLKGEQVYWQGGNDEKQTEAQQQFEYDDPNLRDPTQVKILDEERSTFVNQMKTSNIYQTVSQGKLPVGVATKSFTSPDGNWQYTVAVYAPSLEAEARQANQQMMSGGSATPSHSGQKIRAIGGVNEDAANPQGASGQVSKTEGL